jgi:cytochrome c
MSRSTKRFGWCGRLGLFNAGLLGVSMGVALLAAPAQAAPASSGTAVAEGRWGQIGRPATPAEVKAWDIDVRPDFKGLPKGSGSVARGQDIWEAKCASCHGVFGESTHVFTPIAGGISAEDLKTGRTASLTKPTEARSTLMKLSQVSTLWDYINRAMPWNAPRSLSTDDVYAVTAYVLNLGDIVPADFTLSDANIREVQARLPNRNGMTTDHGMWKVNGKPDVVNVACMKDCPVEGLVKSSLPEVARPAHGNLADQVRPLGPVRGAVTVVQAAPSAKPAPSGGAAMQALANKGACLSCHQVEAKVVGPSFKDVAAKYKGDAEALSKLAAKIKSGGQGVWGAIPMPPAQGLSDDEIAKLAKWILDGSPQ